MIDEKTMKLFDAIIKINKRMILDKKNFSAMCALVEEGHKVGLVMMPFTNYDSKAKTREILKKLVLSKKTIAYMLGMDTKMTMMDMTDKNKTVVKEALVHCIFTPNDNLVKFMIYSEKDGRRFIENEMDDNSGQQNSVWNVWNPHGDDDICSIEKDYEKFKKDNPDKYQGVI